MSENLNRFMVDVATDRDRLARFTDNPNGELSRAGLTADEGAAVLSGDARRLTAALGGSRSGINDDVLGPPPAAPRRRAPAKKRPSKPARKKGPSSPARKKRPATPARRKRPAAPARRRKGASRPSRKKR